MGTARANAVIYLTTFVCAVLGFTWILWSNPSFTLNESQSATPIPRVVGSLALLSTVLAPLLIEPLLRRTVPMAEPGALPRPTG